MLAPNAPRPNIFKRVLDAVRPPRATPFREMGVSGTAVWSGYVQQREKSPKWTGAQRYVTISDMATNASIVAAGVHHFVNLVARPSWTIEPADDSDEAKKVAEFVEEVLQDLTTPWSRVVRRATMFRFYGFGVQEWTAKRRPDGRVGLESVEPRPQATIERWAVAEGGAVEGVWQRDPQTGRELGIPRKKILYLVDDTLSDSPEGVGIFRHLAEPWERLQAYYALEARAFERDLRGTPVGRVPYTLLREAVVGGSMTEAEAKALTQAMEKFVELQVKQSDTAITLDSIPYFSQAADGSKVAAVPQWGLELLQGGAAGMGEVAQAITRTQMEMARVLAAEHLMLGESSGNRALSEDKSRNLYLVANAVLKDIAAGTTQDVVPNVCLLNGIPEELYPRCKPEDVAFKDAEMVASVLAKMAQAGAVLAPDDPVVEDVRALMGVSAPAPVSPELRGLPGGQPAPEPGGGESGEEDELDEGEGDADARKAYDPDQPRAPAGTPEGGQWVSSGGSWTDSNAPGVDVISRARVVREGDSVSGLEVRGPVPNEDSIGATFEDYEVLPGLREVPYDWFTPTEGTPDARTRRLAEAIEANRRISPLIVGVDAGGPFILEGGHRFDALHLLDKKTFPALIALDGPIAARLKKAYDPDQPRAPAGTPEGGQWTEAGDTGAANRGEDADVGRSPALTAGRASLYGGVSGKHRIGEREVKGYRYGIEVGGQKVGELTTVPGNVQTSVSQGARYASGRGEGLRWRVKMGEGPAEYRSSRREALRTIELRVDRMKKAYDPDQPRKPAGSPAGGQWTSEGGLAEDADEDAEERHVGVGEMGREDLAPAYMTNAEIKREYARLERQASQINRELIAAGRGSERPSDRRDKTDALSRRDRAVAARMSQLRAEVGLRYGPGFVVEHMRSGGARLKKTYGPRTLYVKRRLLNAGALREWARSQGIRSALPAGDMHVTVAFSREPVDWSQIEPDENSLTIAAVASDVHQFPARSTPNGALVLRFASPELERRWAYYQDAGASWDFAEYRPHVTITYSVPEADVGAIEPYRGPLIFGPEEWAEVNDGWAGEIVEEPLRKRSIPRLRSRRV